MNISFSSNITNRKMNIHRLYRQGVIAFLVLVVLGLSLLRLKDQDYYAISDTEPGYVQDMTAQNGDRILAEGCERIYLYPGSYRLAIQTTAPVGNAYIQVYDKWGNHVLAEQSYDENETVQVLYFQTDDVYVDVAVRTLANDDSLAAEDLQIEKYFLESSDRVCTDTEWSIVLLVFLLVLLCLGYRRMMRNGQPAFLILTTASTITALPFYTVGLQVGHDLEFQITRIINIGLAMRWGYYPERLNILSGGDTIIPIMYPEAFLAGAGFMVSTGATVTLAYKVLCACITYATAYIAYYAARQILNTRPALLFALLWLTNPFRMNELLVRAALGEALALTFLPLIAIGMWQMFHESCRRGGMHLVLGYTGLLASHMLTTMVAAVFCAIYVVAMFVAHPRRFAHEIRRMRSLAVAAVITVLVNMYYLIPFLSYYSWNLHLSNGENLAHRVQQSTAPLWQLFMGEVGYGINLETSQLDGEMPLSIGVALLAGVVIWIGYTSWQRYLYKEDAELQHVPANNAVREALFIGLCGVFMSSCYFPWNALIRHSTLFAKVCGSVQFAWRYMMIPALLLSFLLAVLLCMLLQEQGIVYRLAATVLLVVSVTSAVGTATYYYAEDELLLTDHFDGIINYNFDYILDDVLQRHNSELHNWPLEGYDRPYVAGDVDDVAIEDYHQEGTGYRFTITNASDQDVSVTVPIFWYGLHRAYLVGETGEVSLECSMNEEYQFTDITIPAGINDTEIYLVYQEPGRYRLGNIISCVTIIVLLTGAIATHSRSNRRTDI